MNLPLPRPPAWIWLLTTQSGPPSFRAAATASSGVKAGCRGDRRAEFAQHRLGLIFVDVHATTLLEERERPQAADAAERSGGERRD